MKTNNKQNLLISSSAKKTIRESVLLAMELNTGIEISRIPFYGNKNATVKDVVEVLKKDLDGFDNRITLHAMFSDLNVAGQDPLLREICEIRNRQSLEVGKALGVDTILFHTGNKGTRHYGSQEKFKERFVSYWKEFIKEFEGTGITVVIENVFEESQNYCYDLFKEINSPNLKLALDVGHVNLYAHNTNVLDWIKLYGEDLYHMHLHNNFRTNDDHSNFENGTLDFNEILTTIKEANINPSFVLEMYKEEDVRKSIEFFKKIMN